MFTARLAGLFLGVLSLSLAAALSQSPPAESPPKSEPKPPPRVDAYGDPLPEGSLVILWTLGFGHWSFDAATSKPD